MAPTAKEKKKVDKLEVLSPPKALRPKARRLGASTSRARSKRNQRAYCGKWSPVESDSSFYESGAEDSDLPTLRQMEEYDCESTKASTSSTGGLPLFAKARFTSIPDDLDLSSSSDEEEIDQLEEDDEQINQLVSLPPAPGLNLASQSNTPYKRNLSSSPPPFSVKRSKFSAAEEEAVTRKGSSLPFETAEEILMEVVRDGIEVEASSDNTFGQFDAPASTVPSELMDQTMVEEELDSPPDTKELTEEEDDDFERWLEDCVEVV